MNIIPSIIEQDIRRRTGGQSFQRGLDYFQSGAIFDARRQGATLKARCEGSRAEAYRVRVTFDAQGVASAECSCPVGDEGACKHIAALLLTWREKPADFAEVEELDAGLERHSKAELVALVKQMLRQRPELESLLDTPLPSAGRQSAPVRRETYRRQAAAVFRRRGYDWGMESGIADELTAIAEIGNGFLEQQDYASAAVVYGEVSGEILDGYEEFNDEGGELASVVGDCVQGLGRCLVGEREDPTTREQILEALFAIYRFDVEAGGVGLSDEVPDLVQEHATAAERRIVTGWIREALSQHASSDDGWRRQEYGRWLLDLEADTLDDEAFLRICRETGRIADLVDRLLVIDRLDQAAAEAAQANDYHLLRLADLFVQHDHGDVALHLVEGRSQTTHDTRVPVWLKDRYKALGNMAAALQQAEKIFGLSPSLDGYKELQQLAKPLGRWQDLQPALLAQLEQGPGQALLIQIYLHEREIDRALRALNSWSMPIGYASLYGNQLRLEVARAAEDTRPQAARDIYQREAERLIAQRGRDNYREACRVLTRARALYEHLGEPTAWATYVAALRERHRSLRALKEELAASKL